MEMTRFDKFLLAVLMAVIMAAVFWLSIALAAPPNHCPPDSFLPCTPPKPEEKLYDTVCRFPDACLPDRVNVPSVARRNRPPDAPAWFMRVSQPGLVRELRSLGGR